MKTLKVSLGIAVLAIALSGCAPTYSLVKPNASAKVGSGMMKVQPGIAWSKAPAGSGQMLKSEVWTQNGPVLDAVVFLGPVKDGTAIVMQNKKAERKVPVFHAQMTPQDLVDMVESYYRIRAGATIFENEALKPTTFLGAKGLDFTYRYVGADEVKRRGRTVISVIDQQLYLMTLDGAAPYFDSAQLEFEKLVASAVL